VGGYLNTRPASNSSSLQPSLLNLQGTHNCHNRSLKAVLQRQALKGPHTWLDCSWPGEWRAVCNANGTQCGSRSHSTKDGGVGPEAADRIRLRVEHAEVMGGCGCHNLKLSSTVILVLSRMP
jgi:hypothetical protein